MLVTLAQSRTTIDTDRARIGLLIPPIDTITIPITAIAVAIMDQPWLHLHPMEMQTIVLRPDITRIVTTTMLSLLVVSTRADPGNRAN